MKFRECFQLTDFCTSVQLLLRNMHAAYEQPFEKILQHVW